MGKGATGTDYSRAVSEAFVANMSPTKPRKTFMVGGVRCKVCPLTERTLWIKIKEMLVSKDRESKWMDSQKGQINWHTTTIHSGTLRI